MVWIRGGQTARIKATVYLLLALLPAASWAVFDYDTLNANRWRCFLTNYGVFGEDVATARAGGEWPSGSGHMYIWGAGLWVGAIPGDTYTAVGYNPNSGKAEFTPGDSADGSTDSLSRVYMYPHHWPAPLSRFPRAPQQRLSDQDAWCCFNDFNTTNHEPHPGGPVESLGIQVYLTTYASTGYLARDFIFLRYEIENQRHDSLKDVLAGIALDPDVGNANNDYYRGYYHRRFARGPGDTIYLDNLACAFSDAEVGWDTTGTVAVELIRTPGNGGATAMKQFTLQTGDPAGDRKQYLALAGYDWWTNPPMYDPIDSLSPIPNDVRFLTTTGPFVLAPGQSESLVVALIAVNCRPDSNPLRVAQAAWTAESLYLAGLPLTVSEPPSATPPTRDLLLPGIARGTLLLPGKSPALLLDISGRRVARLSPGTNDLRRFAPGVYFVQQRTLRKLVITR